MNNKSVSNQFFKGEKFGVPIPGKSKTIFLIIIIFRRR